MKKWDNPSAKKLGKISNAVEKTKNIIITYNDEPIDAVFTLQVVVRRKIPKSMGK